MVEVRNTSPRDIYVSGVAGFEAGATEDIPRRHAEYLDENRDHFEIVDEGYSAGSDGDVDEADEDGDGTAEDEDGADETFDADEWLDADYTERADRVRGGEVDEHLDQIIDEETSTTVVEAAEERKDEL
jgi:hypothetical protein